jgi:hypothetical protein
LQYAKTGQIVFQSNQRAWSASPEQLGLHLDPIANAQAAYRLGRSGNIFKRL